MCIPVDQADEPIQPNNQIKVGMSKPLATKIQLSGHNGQEMSCNVSPDKGLFGPGYALVFTIPDFKTNHIIHWEKDHNGDDYYVNKKFDMFLRCLQGTSTSKWDLCATKFEADKRIEKNFMKCKKDYL